MLARYIPLCNRNIYPRMPHLDLPDAIVAQVQLFQRSAHLNSPHALQTIALHRGWKVFGSQEQDVGLRQIEKGFLNIYFTTTDPMTPPLLSHTREKIGVTTGYTAPPSFPYLQ